jgi:hypothetical protein
MATIIHPAITASVKSLRQTDLDILRKQREEEVAQRLLQRAGRNLGEGVPKTS